MTTKQDKQPNARKFRPGDRIIYNGQFIGTLETFSGSVGGICWKVRWEDGAQTGNVYPESDMVFANGGPGSAQRNETVTAWNELCAASERLGAALEAWKAARQPYPTIDPHGEKDSRYDD